jgi:hypothetical protein
MHLLALAIAFVLHFVQIPTHDPGVAANSPYRGALPASAPTVTEGAGGSDPWGGSIQPSSPH